MFWGNKIFTPLSWEKWPQKIILVCVFVRAWIYCFVLKMLKMNDMIFVRIPILLGFSLVNSDFMVVDFLSYCFRVWKDGPVKMLLFEGRFFEGWFFAILTIEILTAMVHRRLLVYITTSTSVRGPNVMINLCFLSKTADNFYIPSLWIHFSLGSKLYFTFKQWICFLNFERKP